VDQTDGSDTAFGVFEAFETVDAPADRLDTLRILCP